MFTNSQVVITGGSFHHIHGRPASGMDRLAAAAAPGAFHNSLQRSDPPKCHKHTREAILQKIMDWVKKKIDTDAFIMWLFGAAGAGKSAIAQTIAEMCAELKLLLASFFFFRSDSLRSNSKQFVATIAYQISVAIPGVRGHIETVIDNDPHILSRSLITQFTALIVDPLERLFEICGTFLPNLIIIDGLDECMDGTQVQILDMIFTIGQRSKFPIAFLVTSRPEQEISTALGGRVREGLIRLPLATDYTSRHDIKCFLRDKFDEIRQTHPIGSDLPSSWPSKEDIKALVDKSSGQFIYASTIVKFVSSPRHRPTHRLEIILGLRPTDKDLPYPELDALYRYVISSIENTTTAVQIIATALTLEWKPVGVALLAGILDLEPNDIKLYLVDLGSLVEYRHDFYDSLSILHATLGDFLFDEARSQELYVNPQSILTRIAQALLRNLTLKDGSCWGPYWAYSCQHLDYHCSKAELTHDVIDSIRNLPVKQILLRNPWPLFSNFGKCITDLAESILSLDIKGSNLISMRYLSEHDKALSFILNSLPSIAVDAFAVLHLTDHFFTHFSRALPWGSYKKRDAFLVLYGLIFDFVLCNEAQKKTLSHFAIHLGLAYDPPADWISDFFSNPKRSQHHAVDNRMHNSVTKRCLSYILNCRLVHFPGIHRWASKSKSRPWLWRSRKPKGINSSQFKWRTTFSLGYMFRNRKLTPFWALSLAFQFLPHLLDKATRSVELIALAKNLSHRYPQSLFSRDIEKAVKAVEHYLARFDREE